jgi:siroheme synthase-like protein
MSDRASLPAAPVGLRFLPVGLDLQGRRCVVVGGGTIGTRKALTLARAGARVIIVSPEVTDSLRAEITAGSIDWVREPFAEPHVEGAFLAVIATDDESVNAAAFVAAERAGALVCDASSGERSQLIFGATLAHGDATIAVFTDGRDPGGARRTRDLIAALVERAT